MATNETAPRRRTRAALADPADGFGVPCFHVDVIERVKARMPSPADFAEARQLFGALSDPTRLQIVFALATGEEMCVCDVAHVLGTTISTASHHLRKLRDLGILADRSDGKMVYYSLRQSLAAELVTRATGVDSP